MGTNSYILDNAFQRRWALKTCIDKKKKKKKKLVLDDGTQSASTAYVSKRFHCKMKTYSDIFCFLIFMINVN